MTLTGDRRYLAGQRLAFAVAGNACLLFPQVIAGNFRVAPRGAIRRAIGVIALAVRAAEHWYQDCGDEGGCMLFGCRARWWGERNGYDRGYRQGWVDGEAAGKATGYQMGFAAGFAAGSAAKG